jgi:dienelactone hydrolase
VNIRAFLAATIASLALISSGAGAETVHFPSATPGATPLQQRLVHERGESVPAQRGDDLLGELHRPAGDGPFPAIVMLHGCAGRGSRTSEDSLSARFVALGYAVLVVDSFATRGIKIHCTGSGPAIDRTLDAYGGLAYLASLPFIDPDRVGVVGYSQGAIAALAVVALHGVQTTLAHHFKVAIAYYPACSGSDGAFAVSTLILIGERDDWTPAVDCQQMMDKRTGVGAPVKLVVYAGARHAFDARGLRGRPVTLLGHRLEYDEGANNAAWAEATALLGRTLRR